MYAHTNIIYIYYNIFNLAGFFYYYYQIICKFISVVNVQLKNHCTYQGYK